MYTRKFTEFVTWLQVICGKVYGSDVKGGSHDDINKLRDSIELCITSLSQDFATPSLKGEVIKQSEEDTEDDEEVDKYKIDERKNWEQM